MRWLLLVVFALSGCSLPPPHAHFEEWWSCTSLHDARDC